MIMKMSATDNIDLHLLKEVPLAKPKWQKLLRKELEHSRSYEGLSRDALIGLLKKNGVLSDNYDTVVSLDFPHYCIGATDGCGGESGWCYTFQGFQSLTAHSSKVGLVDFCIRNYPEIVVSKIVEEVNGLVRKGLLPYPNLRFSGSGEVAAMHIDALKEISNHGINLWGFSRNIRVASILKSAGIKVIFSCDNTTSQEMVQQALESGLSIAYTSCDVTDAPAYEVEVVFPLHRGGKVKQVVNHPMNCPKVISEYFSHSREPASCQLICTRCHE